MDGAVDDIDPPPHALNAASNKAHAVACNLRR
jgi:hypothetical protein